MIQSLFFEDLIVEDNYLGIGLNINEYSTGVGLTWNFRFNFDEDRHYICFHLELKDHYKETDFYKYPDISSYGTSIYKSYNVGDEADKIQNGNINFDFDDELNSAFQKLKSDPYYQTFSRIEPIAMTIYVYSDN